MSFGTIIRTLLVCVALAGVFIPHSLLACAACFGQSDSALAKGMNMGIFSLLAVVVVVLGGIASFFIYLARKSSAAAVASAQTPADKTQ